MDEKVLSLLCNKHVTIIFNILFLLLLAKDSVLPLF